MKNLFHPTPSDLPEELIEVLLQNKSIRIERIVSTGHVSPSDHWFDQEELEWVIVLKGEAKLLFAGKDEPIHMKPGDYISIHPHERHRVDWTSPNEPTVWLAVFCKDE